MDEQYHAGFRPLFACIAPPQPAPLTLEPETMAVDAPPHVAPSDNDDRAAAIAIMCDAALFGARLRESLEARLDALLAGIAREVLARELRLAPPEIRTIVNDLLAESAAPPLEVRVAPLDAARLPSGGIPVRVDAALLPGEAVLEYREGACESRLSLRLAHLVERLSE